MTRIGFDATPLLATRTGIGRYVGALADYVADADNLIGSPLAGADFIATAFSRAPMSLLRDAVPAPIGVAGRPIPARALQAAWSRLEVPTIGALTGKLDLFHGTNFVLPPLGSARGVLTIHDLAYLRFPATVSAASARYRHLVPRGIKRTAVICTLTQAVADEVADQYGVPADRIVITPPGVDESWFTAMPISPLARESLGLPEQYLVAVGTIEPRKNLAALISAHRLLCRSDPATPTLVIAGPSGWGPSLGITPDDRIVLTGYLPTSTLQSLVAGAQLLASASLYEGFGLPPLEALACGVAVVASDLPAAREVLGDCAVYSADTGAQALATVLAEVLAREPSALAVQQRRDRAREWTWRRCCRAILTAYGTALAD